MTNTLAEREATIKRWMDKKNDIIVKVITNSKDSYMFYAHNNDTFANLQTLITGMIAYNEWIELITRLGGYAKSKKLPYFHRENRLEYHKNLVHEKGNF